MTVDIGISSARAISRYLIRCARNRCASARLSNVLWAPQARSLGLGVANAGPHTLS